MEEAVPRRRRRTAEEARRAILEAAQKRLAECGPEEIRLQDIASDLGISHPAILHHFGSREALMRDLSLHSLRALNEDLVAALRGSSDRELTGWLDRVVETLGDRGHARLLAWSLLTGRLGEADEPANVDAGQESQLLRDLARAVHERRVDLAGPDAEEDIALEDSIFAVQFAAAALLGDALMGPLLRRSAGVDPSDASRERFRVWFGRRIGELLVPRRAEPGDS